MTSETSRSQHGIEQLRRAAIKLGALELVTGLLWCALGAGIYGSPLFGLRSGQLLAVAALLALSGPFSMLPAALLARWWHRAVGRWMLAGGLCASLFAAHSFGLARIAYSLYINTWVLFVVVSIPTVVLGAMFLMTGRWRTGGFEVISVGLATTILFLAVATVAQRLDDATPWRTRKPVESLLFSPDGNTLVAAGGDWPHVLSVVDAASGHVKVIAEGPQFPTMAPDGQFLITSGEKIQIWDTKTWQERLSIRKFGIITSFGNLSPVSQDGILAINGKNTLRLVDIADGHERGSVGHEGDVRWLAFAPDGRTLATVAFTPGSEVKLWDVALAQVQAVLSTRPADVTRFEFSPDSQILAMAVERISGGQRIGALELWNVPERRRLAVVERSTAPFDMPWFAPDGRTLITVRLNAKNEWITDRWILRDVTTAGERASIPHAYTKAWVLDGKAIVTVRNKGRVGRGGFGAFADLWTVTSWDVSTGQPLENLGELDFEPRAIASSRDGRLVAVGGGDATRENRRGEIKLFHLAGR